MQNWISASPGLKLISLVLVDAVLRVKPSGTKNRIDVDNIFQEIFPGS